MDLADRLLAAAHHHQPGPDSRSRLAPFREAILVYRAKRTSYARIAALLRGHGVVIQASAVGNFCLEHCSGADLERARRELTLPKPVSRPGSAGPSPSPSVPSSSIRGRPGRIARDDL